MKKRLTIKHKKRKLPHIFSFFIFILGIYIGFNILDKSKLEITDKELVSLMLKKSHFIEEKNPSKKIKTILKKIYENPSYLLLPTTSNLVEKKQPPIQTIPISNNQEIKSPLIYIYNSHQTEEYAPSTFLEYSINPTVMMANYILEENLKEKNILSYVEESSIKEILNSNNWKYSYSYKASRLLLEQRKKEYPSLKYYIDIHRDSLKKERTTVEINGKSYAKLIFLIGLDNKNYQENLAFTTKINDLLNKKYPNLSKGIYKKGGEGVNGIYNQDFSPYVVLIEIGGYENTTTEVLNSTIAFAECFMEVISTNEVKEYN